MSKVDTARPGRAMRKSNAHAEYDANCHITKKNRYLRVRTQIHEIKYTSTHEIGRQKVARLYTDLIKMGLGKEERG